VSRGTGARQPEAVSRREFLAFGIGGTLFGWIPWFKPKSVSLAGARFQILRTKHARRHFLVIHGDEETARQVLTDYLESYRGIGFVIEGHTRDVQILSGQIDPNRMFSRAGAEANLRRLNPKWSRQQIDDALRVLDHGRERLLRQFFPGHHRLLIALHNNTESYSVNDELGISNARSIPQPNNPHAFFLCTDPNDYRILAGSPYNVVLQNRVRAPDDGSLSRRAAARFQRYMNLEVRRGDAALQRQMLEWADENLR
jgi:hypothetical protein